MRHVMDVPATRRWPWALGFVGLIVLSAFVLLNGLIAPWTAAPEGVTVALVLGGVVLGLVAFAGLFSAIERIGQPVSWLVRWLTVAVLLGSITVCFNAYG